jgi:hypothetical protein
MTWPDDSEEAADEKWPGWALLVLIVAAGALVLGVTLLWLL